MDLINKAKAQYKELKKYAVYAALLCLILLLGGMLLWIIHGMTFLTHNINDAYGGVGSCPYTYSSLGLHSQQANDAEIFGSIVNTVIGIVYTSNGQESTGVLAGYRNNILTHPYFQVIRIMLVILVTAYLGISFIFGFTRLRASELLKKFVVIAMFLWATSASTYVLYDEFLEPLVLKGTQSLAYMINAAMLDTIGNPELQAYVARHPGNEFVVMDAILTSLFSETLFNKIGSIILPAPSLAIFAMMIYVTGCIVAYHLFLFVISIIFYKLVIVIGLSLFPLFALFIVSFAAGGGADQYSRFFKRYAEDMLIKPSISIVLLTFVVSLACILIFELVAGALSFKVCIKHFWHWPGILRWIGSYDYFTPIKPTSKAEVFGRLLAVDVDKIPLYINSKDLDFVVRMFGMNILVAMFLALIMGKLIKIMQSVANGFGLGSSLAKSSGFEDLMNKVDEKLRSAPEAAYNAVTEAMDNGDGEGDDGASSKTSNTPGKRDLNTTPDTKSDKPIEDEDDKTKAENETQKEKAEKETEQAEKETEQAEKDKAEKETREAETSEENSNKDVESEIENSVESAVNNALQSEGEKPITNATQTQDAVSSAMEGENGGKENVTIIDKVKERIEKTIKTIKKIVRPDVMPSAGVDMQAPAIQPSSAGVTGTSEIAGTDTSGINEYEGEYEVSDETDEVPQQDKPLAKDDGRFILPQNNAPIEALELGSKGNAPVVSSNLTAEEYLKNNPNARINKEGITAKDKLNREINVQTLDIAEAGASVAKKMDEVPLDREQKTTKQDPFVATKDAKESTIDQATKNVKTSPKENDIMRDAAKTEEGIKESTIDQATKNVKTSPKENDIMRDAAKTEEGIKESTRDQAENVKTLPKENDTMQNVVKTEEGITAKDKLNREINVQTSDIAEAGASVAKKMDEVPLDREQKTTKQDPFVATKDAKESTIDQATKNVKTSPKENDIMRDAAKTEEGIKESTIDQATKNVKTSPKENDIMRDAAKTEEGIKESTIDQATKNVKTSPKENDIMRDAAKTEEGIKESTREQATKNVETSKTEQDVKESTRDQAENVETLPKENDIMRDAAKTEEGIKESTREQATKNVKTSPKENDIMRDAAKTEEGIKESTREQATENVKTSKTEQDVKESSTEESKVEDTKFTTTENVKTSKTEQDVKENNTEESKVEDTKFTTIENVKTSKTEQDVKESSTEESKVEDTKFTTTKNVETSKTEEGIKENSTADSKVEDTKFTTTNNAYKKENYSNVSEAENATREKSRFISNQDVKDDLTKIEKKISKIKKQQDALNKISEMIKDNNEKTGQ